MYGTYKFLTKYLQIKNLYIFIKHMSPVVSSNNPSESHNFQKKIGPYSLYYIMPMELKICQQKISKLTIWQLAIDRKFVLQVTAMFLGLGCSLNYAYDFAPTVER